MSDTENPNLSAVRAMMAAAEAQRDGLTLSPPAPEGEAEEALRLSPEEILDECKLEPETDIGNARRLLTRYGEKILHVARIGWHGYDGRRFKEDEDGSIIRPLAQKTAEFILDEAIAMDATEEEQAAIVAGDQARADYNEMMATRAERDAKERAWSAEETTRLLKLERLIEEGAESKKKADGRESARFRHAKSSCGTAKINNMLTEAAPHCSCTVDSLNRDRLAFNCKSGTLRFVQEEDEESEPDDPRLVWRVRVDAHRQRDFITKLAPITYRPGDWRKRALHFDKFLKTILPDPEIREFLKRFFGYCLTGLIDEQCLLFFFGAGRNGKSTLLDILKEVFGDYAVVLSIDSFTGDTKRGGAEATPDLARLPGTRLVVASEPEMGVKLQDAKIKVLTGGEKIPVRRLHQDFFEVDPHFKIVLAGNHKPRIDDNSDGTWRRVHLVPFDVQIPREDVDRALPRKLREEAEGIFGWLVEGAQEYLNFGLQPPAKVLAATQEYREESDPIGSFIRIGCIVTGKEEDTATPGDLSIGYANYALREGAPEFKHNTFTRRFPDYARKNWEGKDGKMHAFWKAKAGTTVYRGIRVRPEFLSAPPPGMPEQRG